MLRTGNDAGELNLSGDFMSRSWTIRDPSAELVEEHSAAPGWMASVLLHVALFAVFAFSLRSCDSGYSGASADDFREVGIYVRDATELADNNPEQQPSENPALEKSEASTTAATPAESVPTDAQLAEAVAPTLDSLPPELLKLPTIDPGKRPSTIGPGTAFPVPQSAAAGSIKDALSGEPAGGAARSAGHGETSFFNIKAEGSRFVYVVDRSGSMLEYGQIQAARNELLASLQSLNPTQQFHVIFYNTLLREMSLQGRAPGPVFATELNRTLAGQFIQGISPEEGTSHSPALRKALGYSPEHIFLLTDGADPGLSSKELDSIKRLNRGRTQIHCIEFGLGSPVPGYTSFMMTLAKDNGGTYRYIDVTKFTKRR